MGVVSGENSLFFATGLDNSGLKQDSFDAVGIIQSMGSKIASINPFAALAVGAIAAFTAISVDAYKLSKNFEQAMKEVETISAATQKNFKGISKEVFELSKITPDGPEKLAKAYYQIVSAGYDGAKGIKLLETASKAAVAGVTDTITAADGITTVLNAFNLEAEEATDVADVMFKTVQLGKTTFSELAANLSTVAPLAASSGIGFDQVSGAIASLTKQGVPTAQAMTQIRAAIVGANEALGDGWSNTLTLQDAFQKLYEEAGGSQVKLQKMVGSIEAVSGILGLAGDKAKGAASDLQAMGDAAGSSEGAFRRMSSSNVNQIDILRNRITATTKGIGDAVLSMSNDIAGGLNDLLEPLDGVVSGLEDERLNLLKLESTVKDSNTSNEERIKLIQELKEKYPGLLSNIDAETISNDELSLSIRKVNDQLINKIILAKKDVEINNQNENTAKVRLDVIEREDEIRKNLVKLAEKEGIILKDNATLIEQSKDFLQQAGRQEGGRLINPIVEFSHQLVLLEKSQQILNSAEREGTKLYEEKQKLADRLGITLEDNSKKITDETKKQLALIAAITKEQYVKNNDVLKQFLNSDNKAIAEAAEKRKAFFDFTPKGDPEEDNTFIDYLKKKEEQYDSYTLAILNKDEDLANKLRDQYDLKEEDYTSYLRALYAETEDHNKKIKILEALNGSSIIPRAEQEVASELEPLPIVLDIKIDTNSINAISAKLQDLYKEFNEAQTEEEARAVAEQIKIYKKKLDEKQALLKEEEASETQLTRHISDMSNIALKAHISNLRKRVEEHKKAGKDIKFLEDEIAQSQEQIGSNITDTIGQITGAVQEASSLFRKFGDEDTAQLLDQLAGVAEGAGSIAKGILTGNPLDVITGALKVLNSAITVEVVSDTEKFENAIKKLESAIEQLDYVISKSIGQDKVTSRKQAIDDLKALEEQAQLAKEAELNARKEVKLLGITVGKKGAGSGTDANKLEELTDKMEEARRKAVEFQEQLNELYTGTTEKTIVDSIIAGLKEGKRSVEDFADNFKELIQNAMLNAFQLKYLDNQIDKFYEDFALAGADSTYSISEIEALKSLYNQILNGAQSELDAINDVLNGAGIGGIGSDTSNSEAGLAGAIRREITEETGSEIAGLLRGGYDLAKQHFEISIKQYDSLNNIVAFSERIADNTANTVLELQNAIIELKKIADHTERHYLLDLG
ncbi:phage tail tape measure protein [Tamlana sp. I1]|uniref:phage tail tape measure protein n=1 Tax=Tamlana sp. I1 TaxID=2762061 RepID=UPI00188E4EB7|nr:phage tail tape measure protein [Tamlana sp. I1]